MVYSDIDMFHYPTKKVFGFLDTCVSVNFLLGKCFYILAGTPCAWDTWADTFESKAHPNKLSTEDGQPHSQNLTLWVS